MLSVFVVHFFSVIVREVTLDDACDSDSYCGSLFSHCQNGLCRCRPGYLKQGSVCGESYSVCYK